MEYIQSKPNNIDVYVNEFHTRIKTEFEKSINKIYNEELSVYRQVIETVVKLPFIQEIIEENKTLKAKLKKLEEADNVVKLEIFDKPVSKTVLDVETIPFSTTVSSEANSGANSDDDVDDESSGDDGDSSEDEGDDKPIASKEDKPDTNKPSADKADKSLCKNQDCSPIRDTKFTEKCSICSGYFADDGSNDIYFLNENGSVGSCDLCKKTQNVCIMKGTGQCVCVNACDEEEEEEEVEEQSADEQSADEEEEAEDEEEELSADEEEEAEDEEEELSADEEDQSPTFPVKIIVNKLDKEEDNLEEVEEEEEPSADQEEVETETEEVDESEDEEEEQSADKEEEEPSADQEDGEVIEIEIDGKTYYCESEENGNIYEDDNGEVGNIVGEIKDGEATFFE